MFHEISLVLLIFPVTIYMCIEIHPIIFESVGVHLHKKL